LTATSSIFKFRVEFLIGSNSLLSDMGIIKPVITNINGESNNSNIFTRTPEFGIYYPEETESIKFEWIIDDSPIYDSPEYLSGWISFKELDKSSIKLNIGKYYVRLNVKDSSNKIVSSDIMAFTILNNSPEIQENFDESGIKSGDIEIPFTIRDFDEDDCNVSVEYFHLGEWKKATLYNSDLTTINLATSKDGTDYSVVWNSSADIGRETVNELPIRIDVDDGIDEVYTLTGIITIDNTKNIPTVILLFDGEKKQTGIIYIPYVLYDEQSSKCSIQVEYFHLGKWNKATEALNSEGISNLSSNSEGIQHIFVWDSSNDVGSEIWNDVILRIKAYNGSEESLWAETEQLLVGNNNSPEIQENFDESGIKSGDIEIPFTIRDFDEDDCNVSVEYFHLGEWKKATLYNSDLTTINLATSKDGTDYSVVWNSSADTLQQKWSDTKIRIIGTDGKEIYSIETGSFTSDNSNSIVIEINFDKNGRKSETVIIPYRLYSLDQSKCSIQVEYYHLGKWSKANEALNSEGISNLSSNSDGISHSFSWDTTKDIGQETWLDVKIRIKPSNGIIEGTWVETETFIVYNNSTNIEETFDYVVQYRLNKVGELIVAVEQKYSRNIPSDIQIKLNEAQVHINNALNSGENVYAAQELQNARIILESIIS
jgi:hypothetical protein